MKNFRIWFKAAFIFQLIFAVIHTLTLFISPRPENKTEEELYKLMSTYRFDFGGGFLRTMDELTLVFSASLSLLFFFGGLVNWYLLKKNLDIDILKGILNINLFIFGLSFLINAFFAFHFPIILSGLIILFLLLSRISIKK